MDNRLLCTVVSLMPLELNEEKPGLVPQRFIIPKSDGKIPAVLVVGEARHYVYLDQQRGHLPVRDSPAEVARSLVNDYITSQPRVGPDAHPGLFWVAGEYTADGIQKDYSSELAEAERVQNNWFVEICKMADDDFNKFQQHNVVSDFQRKIAQMIGWTTDQHEWMAASLTQGAKKCPACGTVAKGIVCASCRCVLDPEKYKTLTFANV